MGTTGTVPPANIRASGQKGDDDAAAPTLPTCASTAPSCSFVASTLDLTEVDATDLSALSSSVVGVVTERDAVDGNAHALAHGAGTAPPFSLGASTVGLVSAEKPKMANGPGKITIGEKVAVKWTLIQVDATSSSVLSCSPAQVRTKSGFSLGAKDVPEDCATLVTGPKGVDDAAVPTLPDCASTDRSYSLGTSTSDLTKVSATDLSSLPLSPGGVVTEKDAADGNTHALAHCAGTAPPSGIGVSTVVLISVVVPKMANGPGKITIQKEVPVQWTLIQVAATSLSKQSCSLAEGVPESGSFSVEKDVPEDGATVATGQNGDEDATGATLPACASTPQSCRIGAVTLDLTEVGVTHIIALWGL